MHRRYNHHIASALSARGKRMAAARWKLDRQRRDAEMPARLHEIKEIEVQNLPHRKGDAVGCLQWHDFSTGKVTRWIVEIGDRADRRVFRSPDGRRSKSRGWSWLLVAVRKVLLGSVQPRS